MTCSSCSNTIECYLENIEGISKSSINYLFGSAEVWFDPTMITKEKIAESIGDIGFEAKLVPKIESDVLYISIGGKKKKLRKVGKKKFL